MKDNFGDWRILSLTTLAQDLPAAFPGGPSHKAGTPVYLSSLTKHEIYNTIGFVTPSPMALSLNISLQSSSEAKNLQSTLALEDTISFLGNGKSIVNKNLPHLYDFFERCMVSIVFAFQSIESFANWSIGRNEDLSMIQRIKENLGYKTDDDIERCCSTEEKISNVLPLILKKKNPKGTSVWENLVKLKRARDSTIHLKSIQINSKKIDDESLFFQFFSSDPLLYPQYAFNIIDYFLEDGELRPRWAQLFEERLNQIIKSF